MQFLKMVFGMFLLTTGPFLLLGAAVFASISFLMDADLGAAGLTVQGVWGVDVLLLALFALFMYAGVALVTDAVRADQDWMRTLPAIIILAFAALAGLGAALSPDVAGKVAFASVAAAYLAVAWFVHPVRVVHR